jgi:hypothetical protein
MSKFRWLVAAALLGLSGTEAMAQFVPPGTAVAPRANRPRFNRRPQLRTYAATPRRPRRPRRNALPRVRTSPLPSYNPPFYYAP